MALCIRDKRGDLIYTRAKTILDTTSIWAETTALHDGLEFCMNNNLFPLVLETDSLFLGNIVEGVWDTPWNIYMEVHRIQKGRTRFYMC